MPYRVVDVALWTDPRVKRLSVHAKLFFLYLITNPHTHVGGLYYLPDVTVTHEAGLPAKELDTLWDTLSRLGLARRDSQSEVVWVKNMLKYQGAGPKIFRSIAKHINTLHKSKLINDFIEHYPDLKRYGIDRVSELGLSCLQEQDQEQDQEQEEIPLPPKAAKGGKARTPSDNKSDTAPSPPPKEPRPRDLLFDAVVEITGADPKLNGAHLGRVCKALRSVDPPYTPGEVRALPSAIADAGLEFTITVGAVEKYIAWVRTPPIRPSRPKGSDKTPDGKTPFQQSLERAMEEIKCRQNGKTGSHTTPPSSP